MVYRTIVFRWNLVKDLHVYKEQTFGINDLLQSPTFEERSQHLGCHTHATHRHNVQRGQPSRNGHNISAVTPMLHTGTTYRLTWSCTGRSSTGLEGDVSCRFPAVSRRYFDHNPIELAVYSNHCCFT